MTKTALYIYCIAEGETPPAQAAEPDLSVVSYADLHAVVRTVDADQFAGLEEIQGGEIPPELADLLLRHDQVVRQTFATHNLVPMRFGTAVTGAPALRGHLAENYDALKMRLAVVRGQAEWGVKWQRPKPAVPEPDAEQPADGRSYLRRRGQQLQADQQQQRTFRSLVDQTHHALTAIATTATPVENSPDAPEVGCAYLVPINQSEAFRAAIRSCEPALTAAGVGMRLTGPWPPYSFCAVKQ